MTGEARKVSISCAECVSACCMAGQNAQFSRREAAARERAGTVLRKSIGNERKDEAWYEFVTDCGNRKQKEDGTWQCSDYENRPEACREYKVGCADCLVSRHMSGVDKVFDLEKFITEEDE